jgi:hypothetical protein
MDLTHAHPRVRASQRNRVRSHPRGGATSARRSRSPECKEGVPVTTLLLIIIAAPAALLVVSLLDEIFGA